jgi:hypothetical protein
MREPAKKVPVTKLASRSTAWQLLYGKVARGESRPSDATPLRRRRMLLSPRQPRMNNACPITFPASNRAPHGGPLKQEASVPQRERRCEKIAALPPDVPFDFAHGPEPVEGLKGSAFPYTRLNTKVFRLGRPA